jgi:hypothetical protein
MSRYFTVQDEVTRHYWRFNAERKADCEDDGSSSHERYGARQRDISPTVWTSYLNIRCVILILVIWWAYRSTTLPIGRTDR